MANYKVVIECNIDDKLDADEFVKDIVEFIKTTEEFKLGRDIVEHMSSTIVVIEE